MYLYIYIDIYNIYIYIWIHTNSPLHRPPAAKVRVVVKQCLFQKRRMTFYFQTALAALGPIHRVERQKPMVKSREEMSVRVRKGDFMSNLLLHYNCRPNVLFDTLESYSSTKKARL